MDQEKFSQFLRYLIFAKSAIEKALGARRNGINHLEDLDPHAEAASLALAEATRAGEALKEIRRGLQTRNEAKQEREANKVPVRAHKRTVKKKQNQSKEAPTDAQETSELPEKKDSAYNPPTERNDLQAQNSPREASEEE